MSKSATVDCSSGPTVLHYCAMFGEFFVYAMKFDYIFSLVNMKLVADI